MVPELGKALQSVRPWMIYALGFLAAGTSQNRLRVSSSDVDVVQVISTPESVWVNSMEAENPGRELEKV